jgi:hypothetical protein
MGLQGITHGKPNAHAGFVRDALEQALHERRLGLVNHSGQGVSMVFMKYSERPAEAAIELRSQALLIATTTRLPKQSTVSTRSRSFIGMAQLRSC